jgi:3-phenylpropionate/trans-cinnamate dioxygenase ferredoxin reductase subunit
VLTGEATAASCEFLGATQIAQLNITRHVARVTALHLQNQEVELANDQRLTYQACLLATGGRARRLTVPGADLPQVVALRNLDDATLLASRLLPGHRVTIVGGGFIGLEVAASAKKMGCEVFLIETAASLMGRVVPAEISNLALALHTTRGVVVKLSTGLKEIVAENLQVRVVLNDCESVVADTVLVGIGIEPELALAKQAGLEVQRGIVVNRCLQTSNPAVFAAGDVAEFPGVMSGVLMRQETWHNAQTQGSLVAKNMLGANVPYDTLPWFWSDQFDHQVQLVGEPALGTQTVHRELDGGGLVIFYLNANEKLVGACGWGATGLVARDLKIIRTMVERGVSASAAVLADPATKLKSLLKVA